MAYSIVISTLDCGKLASTVECLDCGFAALVPHGELLDSILTAVKRAHSIRHDKKAASPVTAKAASSRAG